MKTTLYKSIFLLAALSANTLSATSITPATTTNTTPHVRKIHFNDISFNATVSGDGFGMQYAPSIGIRFGNRTILSGGPLFCATDWKNTGYLVGIGYLVMNEEESFKGHMRLSLHATMEQFSNQCLSSGTIRTEKRMVNTSQTEGMPAFEKMRFSGWEYAVGFAMSYQCRFGLFFKTEAGFAYYNSSDNSSSYTATMRENRAGCLKLGAGMGWKF